MVEILEDDESSENEEGDEKFNVQYFDDSFDKKSRDLKPAKSDSAPSPLNPPTKPTRPPPKPLDLAVQQRLGRGGLGGAFVAQAVAVHALHLQQQAADPPSDTGTGVDRALHQV